MAKVSEEIQVVSCNIGKALLQKIAPETLDQFEAVKRRAFPRTLKDVTFGEATDLVEILVPFVKAVADVLDAQGAAIYRTSTRPDALVSLEKEVREILNRLEEWRQKEQRKEQRTLIKALPGVLQEKIDDIIPVISPAISVSEEQREILRQCVLRIIHADGGASTGFLLCSRGHMLTAAHVVQGAEVCKVAFRYGSGPHDEIEGEARVIHIDDQPIHRDNTVRDIAILEFAYDTWERWQEEWKTQKKAWKHNLQPPLLSKDWAPQDPVFCLGYQQWGTSAQPCSVAATIHPWDPILLTRIQKDKEEYEYQYCLCLVPLPTAPFSFGISGGPVLKLEGEKKGRVIGMVTGTEFPAWRQYEENGRTVWLSSPPGFGFAVPLSDVATSWPKFKECCLRGVTL